MNPLTRIPDSIRFALYLIWGIGYPIMLYTKSKGWTGDEEMDLFNGLGVFLGATAASNMHHKTKTEGN